MNAVGGFPAETRYETAVLDGVDGFAQIAVEWQALSLAVARPSCFAAPSYFQAWRDTLSDDVTPLLLTARRAGRLAGVMPLMRARVRRGPLCAPRHDFAPSDRALLGAGKARPIALRQLSPIVSMPATWSGPAPLCHAVDRAAVIGAMAGHIAGLPGWDSFALPVDVGPDQDMWLAALQAAGLSPWVHQLGRQIAAIGVVEPFAAKAARQNHNYRKNMRRAVSTAAQAGMAIDVFEGRAEVVAQLPALAAVAQDSWKQTGRSAEGGLTLPYAGRQQQFFERLLTDHATDSGLHPVLAVATCDGQPVAVMLTMRHGDWLSGLVTFRSKAAPETSPGILMLARMIDWTHERGLSGFDLNTTQEWARHLVDEVRLQNIIVSFAPTLRGRMLRMISAATRAVR
jgi:hypothetical protein